MAELQRFHRKTILWVVVVSFFSTLTFLAAGERLRMTGDYIYEGRKIYTFNDQKELGKSGSGGCSHEWWHRFNPKKENEQLRAHAHMKMRSTESGDGRHSDVKRELSGVFHAISSANGRFKTGQFMDVSHEGLDVYNTMLTAMDCQTRPGPEKRETTSVDKIRS